MASIPTSYSLIVKSPIYNQSGFAPHPEVRRLSNPDSNATVIHRKNRKVASNRFGLPQLQYVLVNHFTSRNEHQITGDIMDL